MHLNLAFMYFETVKQKHFRPGHIRGFEFMVISGVFTWCILCPHGWEVSAPKGKKAVLSINYLFE